jgi:hypothetical protein
VCHETDFTGCRKKFNTKAESVLSKNGLHRNNGSRVLTERCPVNKWLKAQGAGRQEPEDSRLRKATPGQGSREPKGEKASNITPNTLTLMARESIIKRMACAVARGALRVDI